MKPSASFVIFCKTDWRKILMTLINKMLGDLLRGLLLRLAYAAEAIVERVRPETYYDLLPENRVRDEEAMS